jgi:hypothetical protein
MTVPGETFTLDNERFLTIHDFSFFTPWDVPIPIEVIIVELKKGRFTYQYEDVYMPVHLPVTPIPEPSCLAVVLPFYFWKVLRAGR